MTLRIIRIIVSQSNAPDILKAIAKFKTIESWQTQDIEHENIIIAVLITLEDSQYLLDFLKTKIRAKRIKKVIISAAEAVLPHQALGQFDISNIFMINQESQRAPREELYLQITKDAFFNLDYVLLLLLSTLVATVGIMQDHLVALIAAMVVAPMLGPNLAMALASVLGDFKLLKLSLKTNIAGSLLCLFFSIFLALVWPHQLPDSNLLQNIGVGYSNVILALASGALAALSQTSRISTAFVGVMVAVALLSPLVTTGIFIGFGKFNQAIGTAILYAINVVCINLAANLVFLLKGVHPHKWYEKHKAKMSIILYLSFWSISLLILCVIIHLHDSIYWN